MSVWGQRGSFTAVAAVLTTWIVLGAVSHLAAPYLPDVETRQPATNPGRFVRDGVRHLVEWRDFGQEAVQLARRTDRPLLIVEGTSWNPCNYRFDRLFSNPDVAEMVNSEFVPVRIDQTFQPLWRASIMQVARTKRGDDLNYGVLVVSPEGRILTVLSQTFMATSDDRQAITVLGKVLDDFGNGANPIDDRLATSERADLTGGTISGMPDLARYVTALGGVIQSQKGRVRQGNSLRLRPLELGLLLDVGATDLVEEAVGNIITEGHLNLLHGGFIDYFDTVRDTEYVQSLTTNSAMLRVLSKLAAVTGSAIYMELADQQADFLDRFVEPPTIGLLLAKKADDLGRADSFSVSPGAAKSSLSREELAVARQWLNLDSVRNRRMIPRVTAVQDIVLRQRQIGPVLKKLADASPVDRPDSKYEFYNAKARLLAALLYSDRVLGKASSLARHAGQAASLASEMHVGVDEILSLKVMDQFESGHLPAHIAYVDLAWQLYLATSDTYWLEQAVTILDKAINLFQLPDGSLAVTSLQEVPQGWKSRFAPEVVDSDTPGAQSHTALLAATIGRVPGQGPIAHDLRSWAGSVIQKSSWVVDQLDFGAATLLAACRTEFDSTLVAFVGPADWLVWTRRWPAIAFIPAGQGLPGREPGFYMAGSIGWHGPLTPLEMDRLDRQARPSPAR